MADVNSHGRSQVFSPYRAIGFVANHVPIDMLCKGAVNFVATSVGKSVHKYCCTDLKLLRVSPILPDEIFAIRFVKHFIVVAAGTDVYLLDINTLAIIGKYTEHNSDIVFITNVGDYIVSIDEENVVNVWVGIKGNKYETYLNFPLNKDTFTITCCIHPATYLNKILFGSKQGKLQLWNIKTHSLIHEFQGWEEPVITLEQAPAIDVVGIGLQSGHIVLYNIKYEKKLMSFHQEFGQVTSISFRTDGKPVMATGSIIGHISLWDLEKKRPISVMRYAHSAPVAGMKYLQRQPALVTSSPDNSLKMWIFDNPDGSERVLRKIEGHSDPPNKLLYYGEYGNVLLTAGNDRTLRYTSVMRGLGCAEFTQGKVASRAKKVDVKVKQFKLPPITCIAAECARAYDWDNVVTCHLGHTKAHTWSSQRKALGNYEFHLDSKKEDKSTLYATACGISTCGNFALIGYANGSLQKYNLQSGEMRGVFGCVDEYGQYTGHKKTVRGVHGDNANFQVISTSADKTIKFWRFKDHVLKVTLKCEVPIAASKLHKESSLLAVAFDNFTISLYDIDMKTNVRNFFGHRNIITDISWSGDGRWLVSSSMDSTIKTWDVPSARLIDCFITDEPPTSVAFSPSGDFLASTHQDNVGIYLWANKVKYSGTYPTPLPNDYAPLKISLPVTVVDGQVGEKSEDGNDENNLIKDDSLNDDYITADQLGDRLITLSMLPETRWRNLVNLDVIKLRNKPKEAPKKPKSAPFFLPSIQGVESKFDIEKDVDEKKVDTSSKFLSNKAFQGDSVIEMHLHKGDKFNGLMEYLKELSAAELEAEFRMLSPEMGGKLSDLVDLMNAFGVLLESGQYYELIQAYIGLFLKLHGDLFLNNIKLREAGEMTLKVMEETWKNCQELMNQSSCLVKYFRSATV